MRLLIIGIGRMKSGPEQALVERYLARCRASGPAMGLTGFDVIEFPESRKSTPNLRKADEEKLILSSVPKGARLILLDERGKSQSSSQFSKKIGTLRDDGCPHLAFVIGGPDGLSAPLRAKGDDMVSFSPLTWPHQLVRIMLAEQIYRSTTILSGHPYHRS